MEPLLIQYELKKRGIRQYEIARDLGLSEMFVSMCIRKKAVSDRVMKEIARRIERNHKEVFPEYYFSEIRRIHRNRRKKAA